MSKHADNEDRCLKTGKRHRPDWSTVTVDGDGGVTYIDVSCADCGRSGCIGTTERLEAGIEW